jgi:hypothetical protein
MDIAQQGSNANLEEIEFFAGAMMEKRVIERGIPDYVLIAAVMIKELTQVHKVVRSIPDKF